MRNRTFLFCILIGILLIGCATFATPNTDRWLEYEIPPSRISYSGRAIMEDRLSDGSRFYVFYERITDDDVRFYWVIMRQDFGWRLDGDTWRGSSDARNVKRGHMYVNPRRQVAVYVHPERTYDVFMVRIETSTTN